MFSGLFSQSMIKISGNQIMQFRQIYTAYEAKSALNMSKNLLKKQVEEDQYPMVGSIHTSIGTVSIDGEEKAEEIIFTLTLTTDTGTQYSDKLSVLILEPELEEELEESPLEEPPVEGDEERTNEDAEMELKDEPEDDLESENTEVEGVEPEKIELENMNPEEDFQNDHS